MTIQEDEARVVAIRLRRLEVPIGQEELPSYDDIGLTDLVEEATDWQLLRGGGWFWGLGSMVVPASPDRFTELAGLFGSTGESVLVAAAAEIEITALRHAILDGSMHRHYGIGQRFFAEAQGSLLLGAGHRM